MLNLAKEIKRMFYLQTDFLKYEKRMLYLQNKKQINVLP